MGEALDFDSIGEETAVDLEKERDERGMTLMYDLEAIKPKFADYRFEAARIWHDAKFLTVTDQETLASVVELGGRAKRIAANIEAQRKAIISESQEFIDGVNGICRSITESLVVIKNSKKEITNPQCAENVLKGKYAQYQSRFEMERLERERKAREEAAALQKKLNDETAEANKKAADEAKAKAEEEAKAKGASPEEVAAEVAKAEESAAKIAIVAPTVPDPVVQGVQNVTRSETGAAAFSKAPWTFKVVDPKLVPREYLLVSDTAVRNVIKQGCRWIPGIEIFQETQVNFRR